MKEWTFFSAHFFYEFLIHRCCEKQAGRVVRHSKRDGFLGKFLIFVRNKGSFVFIFFFLGFHDRMFTRKVTLLYPHNLGRKNYVSSFTSKYKPSQKMSCPLAYLGVKLIPQYLWFFLFSLISSKPK